MMLIRFFLLIIFTVCVAHSGLPNRSPCPRALKINTNYQWRSSLHFICLQMRANQKPQLEVIEYNSQRPVVSIQINEMNINQMASFVDEDGALRVLVAQPDRLNGTSMYSFDSQGNYINETFTTNTQLVSTMSVWRLELNWEWHLATANHPYVYPLMNEAARNSRKPLPETGPIISIHSWKSSYFDRYQLIQLPFDAQVNKLEPMHINDQEFLIVALESSKQQLAGLNRLHYNSNLRTDSMIFKLDFGDGTLNWVQFQYLNTRHAIDASSFKITHKDSLKEDYYVALIGQSDPEAAQVSMRPPPINSTGDTNGRPGELPLSLPPQHGLLIYKYLGDRFIETHSVPVDGASRLDTISYGQGDSYVVVAILSGWSKQISLYLFDGLHLSRQELQQRPGPVYTSAPPGKSAFARTINSDSLRLFRAPTPVSAYEKRTLDEDLLGLTFATFPNSSDNYDEDESGGSGSSSSSSSTSAGPTNSSSTSRNTKAEEDKSLFEIPIGELIAKSTKKEVVHDKRSFLSEDLLGWCKAQIEAILGDGFETSKRLLADLPRIDQGRPIQLNGDVVIEGDLHISNLLYVNKIEDNSGPSVAIQQAPMDYTQTFDDIERAHQAIDATKERVDQILVDDGSIQDIYTPLRFERLVLECVSPITAGPLRFLSPPGQVPFMSPPPSCLQVGELRADTLNSRDIRNIREQALLTGRSMKITHDVRFEHLILRGKTSILDTLNGIRIEDIVFRLGPTTGPITGHKNLRGPLLSSANMFVDRWFGLPVDRNHYLTSSGDQRVGADLRFNHVIFDEARGSNINNASSRIEMLNGLHLDTHLDQIARSDQVNHFSAPVSFDELIIQGPTHFPASSHLSSVDIEDLWVSTMFKHSQQNVTAPIEFLDEVHVSYGGAVVVGGLLNGALLRPDNVLMRDRNYVLRNPIIFDGDVGVRHLEVDRHLNGIHVLKSYDSGRPELALLYNTGQQLLTADKILNEVRLGGESFIQGTINGHLNLTQLDSLVHNNGRPYRFNMVHLRGQNIQIGPEASVHVSQSINDLPANDVCQLANRLAQTPSEGSAYDRLRFDGPVTFSELRCSSINGFNDLGRSFLTRHGNQRVSGTLRLLNGVLFNSTLNIVSSYNNLNVSAMSLSVTQAIGETISGHRDFYGDLYIDDLNANLINDLPLSQVFLAKADNPQLVTAPMVFDHLDIENVLIVGQDLSMRSFNGLNVSDIIANTLQFDTPQIIYNHVELDHLHILSGANLTTNSLNGRDLRQVYADAVLVDTPQQILAPKVFNGPVRFTDRVFLRYGLDGLSESELKLNLLLQGDELVENDLEFDNDVTIMKALEIQTGLINDLDVNMFVDSMLSEQGAGSRLRLVDNSSLRFHDVRLNNLVVTGTIQGLDLSRDALFRNDNLNGSYNANINAQQTFIDNQRIFDQLYPTKNFRVQTNHQNQTFAGMCRIHSCPQVSSLGPVTQPPHLSALLPSAPPLPQPMGQFQLPTQQFQNQSPINGIIMGPIWRPLPIVTQTHTNQSMNYAHHPTGPPSSRPPTSNIRDPPLDLVDPKFLEYQNNLKALAIEDLTSRVNRFLSFSFYYEIAQKHPLLGPVLHATKNPIPTEAGNAWLLLKAASKRGEPCLQRGQKIDVMSQPRNKGSLPLFTVSSRIQETSNPLIVESLVVGNNYYVFVVDIHPEEVASETASQVLVYLWDYRSGMYELRQRLAIDGFPTAMKTFVANQFACIALVNPRVVQSNHSGAPLLYCQQAPMAEFNQRIILPLHDIFDLDIVSLPSTSQIIVAALSQQHTEQVGDLLVSKFDIATGSHLILAMRRTARPLKLHFIKQLSDRFQLIVSEGITSNDAAQAVTRIFTLQKDGRLIENQIIKDNQFSDIQSVVIDTSHSMVFLKSTHSISIYAPIRGNGCELSLIQRLPLKGANKFLVFNNEAITSRNSQPATPYGHILVLSKDDCEHQQYSTVILRPRFV